MAPRHALPALVAALALFPAASGLARAQDRPVVAPLAVNPLRAGLDGWEPAGPREPAAAAFTFEASGSTLAIKGPPGREPAAIFYAPVAWDRLEMDLRVKKGAKRLRVLVRAAGGAGDAAALEIPRPLSRGDTWSLLTVRARDGKAVLLRDGEEVASAAVPEGSRLQVGLEAPPGAEGVLTDLRLRRAYENAPPLVEEEFTSLFDGKALEPWAPEGRDALGTAEVREGLLVVEVRATESARFRLEGRRFRAYEWRMRVYWGSGGLLLRPLDRTARPGDGRGPGPLEIAVGDHLDPAGVSDVRVRVSGGRCTVTVDGRAVHDAETGEHGETGLSFGVLRGNRCLLRDLRVRELEE